jgi:hypothetical protein
VDGPTRGRKVRRIHGGNQLQLVPNSTVNQTLPIFQVKDVASTSQRGPYQPPVFTKLERGIEGITLVCEQTNVRCSSINFRAIGDRKLYS